MRLLLPAMVIAALGVLTRPGLAVVSLVQMPEADTAVMQGVVVSSSGAALVIRTDEGAQQSFDVDATSSVPPGIVAGTRVAIQFRTLPGGRRKIVTAATAGASVESSHPLGPSPTPTPTASPSPLVTPTPSPTPTPRPRPTGSPRPTQAPTPTPTPGGVR
jgi:hypothetical protein